MNLENIIVVPKMSKYEWDMQKLKLNHNELMKKYYIEKVDTEKILESHNRQTENLNNLLSYIPKMKVITRDQLSVDANLITKNGLNVNLVIAFGGDNHFQYVSHFLEGIPILGINSDPVLSEGAALYVKGNELSNLREILIDEKFEIELWTRLEIFLNGKKLPFASSEVFFGENLRKDMSRHILEYDGKKEEQKSSGLLVSTGLGSTGWYDSAVRFVHPSGKIIPKVGNKGVFIVTEPYHGKLSGYSLIEGDLDKGKEIKLYSLNDNKGSILIDCLDEYRFCRGDSAVIRISDKPLRALKPKLN